MTKTIIVPKEHMDILDKYLCDSAVTLIPESILDKLPKEQAAYLRNHDRMEANYDHGGDPDIWVDIVTSTDHMFLDWAFPDVDEDQGESPDEV